MSCQRQNELDMKSRRLEKRSGSFGSSFLTAGILIRSASAQLSVLHACARHERNRVFTHTHTHTHTHTQHANTHARARQATPWPLEGGPSAALRASFLSCSWRWPCRPLCCKTRAQCQFSSRAFRSSARCCCNFFSSSSSRACSPRATHLPFCSPNTNAACH